MVSSSQSLSTPSPPKSCVTSKPSAVLFDIDGTLAHTDPVHFAVFRDLLLDVNGFNGGDSIDEEFFRANISGRQNLHIAADFFPDWSVERREEWSAMKEARFRDAASSSMMERKMPGLDRVREWMEASSVRRAAVTNAPRPNAEAIIGGIGYDGWFETLVIGDECERAKPDPFPYQEACRNLGVDPRNCIVFEDSPSGAKAGTACGAYVIGILSGNDSSALLDAGCSLLIEDFDDPKLWKYLEQASG
eukprot:CAMPEP_0113569416 /NCGR_PEP_ID=MMETSP0015_2-20120614/24401_1 /TAXON_ID=2838 /ORGANISM="Odontella" /LENGTH=246 /DNA_ID=CAMNT_0000472083 /DNA_START=222 /DNA_END=962 /DNA_ORIENTATION=+ /assembly_acc=CAM_ASM_000160